MLKYFGDYDDLLEGNPPTFRESPWHINSFFRNIDRFG